MPDKYDDAAIITIEWYDVAMACKVIENKVSPLTGTRTLNHIPFEDAIHPHPLPFDPPLIEHAVGEKNGFAHHWEKLDYVFALPNPADFPVLPTLTNEDRVVPRRYAAVCRQLAGYSALNEESGLTIASGSDGHPVVELLFPTPEAFGGTAIAFRQLHADDEPASFSRTKGRLMKAINLLPADERSTQRGVVAQWATARGKLMNNQLEYIVAKKVGESEHAAPDDFPFSYWNINPQNLILTFNYGDTIHFSGEQERLSTLLEFEANAAYYKHAVLLAVTNLSHLYFGFALLAEAAMGESAAS